MGVLVTPPPCNKIVFVFGAVPSYLQLCFEFFREGFSTQQNIQKNDSFLCFADILDALNSDDTVADPDYSVSFEGEASEIKMMVSITSQENGKWLTNAVNQKKVEKTNKNIENWRKNVFKSSRNSRQTKSAKLKSLKCWVKIGNVERLAERSTTMLQVQDTGKWDVFSDKQPSFLSHNISTIQPTYRRVKLEGEPRMESLGKSESENFSNCR
ncbi:hypothetical protein JTB14_022082 [Gonioctena quinquepunctata]|nr:hypothetical protein JTB14_022082 [Gonioctena quinquepunctata]